MTIIIVKLMLTKLAFGISSAAELSTAKTVSSGRNETCALCVRAYGRVGVGMYLGEPGV